MKFAVSRKRREKKILKSEEMHENYSIHCGFILEIN